MTNKPSWSKAPKWANWLAMDGNQVWWWYHLKPRENQDGRLWDNQNYSMYEPVGSMIGKEYDPEWSFTLEHRPKP